MLMTARCCCKRCTISVLGEPTTNGICHCGNCRARTGSAFGWSAYFRDHDVEEISGPLKEYNIPEPNPQVRSFCVECGTTLFWRGDHAPGKVGIAGGCFVDQVLVEPEGSYADNLRLPWVKIPPTWKVHIFEE